MTLLSSLKFYGFKTHRWLAYIGAFALCLYALSGITHPIMAWFGTNQIEFRPPVIAKNHEITITKIPDILKKYALKNVSLAKIIPTSNHQTLLQITQEFNKPRRYFDLSTGNEIINYDFQQAQFISSYYTGLSIDKIKSTEFITEFNTEYPPINKLLPVYKITYNTPDNIIAFIDTEISQLASLSNNTQRYAQIIFQNIHTLSFLDDYEFVRLVIAMILLLSLLSILISGITLLYSITRRKITDRKRKFHRILAHFLWIPLLFFIVSGMYHLLHYAFQPQDKNHRFIQPFAINENLTKLTFTSNNINDLTFIHYHNQLYYRISTSAEKMSVDQHAHHDLKNKKFDGLSREKSAIYINAQTGQQEAITDKDIILEYAKSYRKDSISSIEKISFFGMGYDFRNKRLPVYKINYNTPNKDVVFIDPATGLFVDASYENRVFENFIFSFFHKWNFMLIVTTREIRDAFIIGILSLLITLTIMGLIMKITLKKSRRSL